ncbi:hypothetical protein TNCV_3670301 [Trichonephila clavipes]|nr:hypothetical protein TNCV_3670301 [Trichonephila clavipes]
MKHCCRVVRVKGRRAVSFTSIRPSEKRSLKRLYLIVFRRKTLVQSGSSYSLEGYGRAKVSWGEKVEDEIRGGRASLPSG